MVDRGTPIEGAEVVLESGSFRLSRYTSSSGEYAFSTDDHPLLTSGVPVTLSVQMWMYKPYAETFTVPEAGDYREIELEHETTLGGYVSDPDDNLVYADVTLSYTQNGEPVELTAGLDEGGHYLFYGVGPSDTGTYDIRAYHPLYRPYHAVIALNMSSENVHNIVMGYYDGSASFKVVNWDGEPLSGVGIQLDGPAYLYRVTGADGVALFNHIPDGLWTYTMGPYGYVPVTGNFTITDGSSESLTVRLIRKGLPVTLQGHVYDSTGAPLRGVRLYFWPDTHPGYTSIWGDTNSEGFYIFTTQNFPELVSGLSGHLKTYLSHYRDADIYLLMGEGVTTQDIRLDLWPSNITVNVTDINGNPVAGENVYLSGPDSFSGTTGADGLAVFEHCPASEYWNVCIYPTNYYYWDGYWYTLTEDRNLTVNVTLVPTTVPLEIKGTVVDDVGVPVFNVKVDLLYINADQPVVWSSVRTNGSGKFACNLYATTANLMRLIFSKDGYRNLTVDIMPWELPVNRIFTLQLDVEETGRVQGYIRNFLGEPLSGITVTASRLGYPSISNITDSSGFYSFDLPAGNYLFTTSSPSHITVSKATTVAPNLIIPVDFELHIKNSVYGRVLHANLDRDPSPLEGAIVELLMDGTSVASTTTDSEGRYEIAAPTSGSYNLTAGLHPYEPASEEVNLQETSALFREIILYPGPYSGIHGTVRDAITGLPLGGVTVTLRRYIGEFVDLEIEVLTGSDGSYSFQSLYPWRTYTLDFEKPSYVPVRDLWFFPGPGEDIEHDQVLQPLLSTMVEGQILCWAGLLQGEVFLDGASMITGPDGRFEFTDIIPGYHVLTAYVSGWAESVYFFLGNGEHLHQDVVFRTFVMDRYPSPGEVLRELQSVGVRLFGGRDGAAATLNLYPGTAPTGTPLPGILSWTGDWLIFTPSSMPPRGPCTARVEVPGEVTATWTFQYLPPTSNPPVITSVTPADGSFFRKPSSLTIKATLINDPGNGLSDYSDITFDGVVIPGTVTGNILTGSWQIMSEVTAEPGRWPLSDGWHTIKVRAFDLQGLYSDYEWKICISNQDGPRIYNASVSPVFSPIHGFMNIFANITEPLSSVYLYFNEGPLNIGTFNENITKCWDGSVNNIRLPDGPVSFHMVGVGMDGYFSNIVYFSTVIDSTGPSITISGPDIFNTRYPEITGFLSDPAGIGGFNVTSSAGTVSYSFSSTSFHVNMEVPSDGYYTLLFNLTDTLGNSRTVAHKILVDTIKPVIKFINPRENDTTRPGTFLSFRLIDNTCSGLARAYLMHKSRKYPAPNPANLEVLLDGQNITDRLIYSERTYIDVVSGNTPYGYDYLASLGSVLVGYNPVPYEYLNSGLHVLKVTVRDRAGNEASDEIHFSTITAIPDITEIDMGMTSGENETLTMIFNVQENSDGGFDKFILEIDGKEIDSIPNVNIGPELYQCTLKYIIKRQFSEGPHTVSLTVIDRRGYRNTLETGFYHLERVPVNLSSVTPRYEYIPDIMVYSGNHTHQLRIDPSSRFLPGSSALYGYCDMDGPSKALLTTSNERSSNRFLPMGGQLSFTVAETPFVDASGAEFLSLWMTDISVETNINWGWGGAILAYFDDGRGYSLLVNGTAGILGFDLLSALNPPAILYAKHEAPWVNWGGIVHDSVASARGADGRLWNNYILKIPHGLNRGHIRVIFVWETVNWFQGSIRDWSSVLKKTVSVSSKIDNVEFIKSVVDSVYPSPREENVPLRPTIWAHFKVPLDPRNFTGNTLQIRTPQGGIINGTAYYDTSTNKGYFTPIEELGGLRNYLGYIGSDIRTIYGRILPKPDPYRWEFQTRIGEARIWQTIRYNGEDYCIFLLWAAGSGGSPSYLPSGSALQSTYGTLLQIHVLKKVGDNYYELGDPDLAYTIFQAAERKAFYSKFIPGYSELVSDSLTEWVEDRADTWSGEALRFLSYLFSNPAPIPDDEDVIKDMIAMILGDGSTATTLTGVQQALSWFSMGISGSSKVNDLVEKLRKMQAEKAGKPFQATVVKDVLKIAELVTGELQFQRELWEFLFKCMWQLRVTEAYRPQLEAILPYTYGSTHEAIEDMLSADINSIQNEIALKVIKHIGVQSFNIIRDKVFEVISKNPYGMVVITTFKVFFALATKFTRWDDVHASTHVALAYANAEDSFYSAWLGHVNTFKLIPSDSVTVYDTSLPALASRLWYASGGNFYDAMVKIGRIVRNWPTSDRESWDKAIASYEIRATDYLKRSSNFIPEVLTSTADIMNLLPLIKVGTAGKPSSIYIGAHSPVALLVTAPDGRRIGYDPTRPEGQRIVNDFGASAFYNSPYSEPQVMLIPAGIGELRIQAFGVDTDSYRITVEVLDEDGNPISGSEWTGNITPGVYKFFSILIDQYGSTYKYDGRAPVIRVTGVSGGGRYTGTVKPLISVADDNLEGWFATLNGKLYTGGPVSSPGVYTLVVRATDGVNVVYSTVIFMIQGVSPVKPPEEGEHGGVRETAAVTAVYTVSGALSEVPSRAVVPPAEMVNVTPTGMRGGYDYTWLAVSLLVSVLIIGVYGALRRRNT
ncbi:carboxypeptidase regulatory-like domain-containing protein [Methanothermobacter marburgensis]|uniref:Carboxypeptidase regulatory-like domain-containing protein n=1 Tax=Methanothermobacter marburgensis (strain ATCC BAA-927 / DSM 2133 / JCM 14651 / NBRC 100331 / OCM 82 / Marburg) TaxID=79929 RepID=D9PW58_METTM|nr:carboxypeptidase regulatory-like domain-containing protein [Methanothermobacter marburgensis]ADL58456.1 hypothetical protein MTBMA_c08610 [Methanothermobacter marburgensis str. Marburg]WBF10586.1 carboxypeptidase regulatory-like domain-containing protein [Methanothermobacter marburgensis]